MLYQLNSLLGVELGVWMKSKFLRKRKSWFVSKQSWHWRDWEKPWNVSIIRRDGTPARFRIVYIPNISP